MFRFPKRARRSIFNILIHFSRILLVFSSFFLLEERTNKTPKMRTSKLFGAVYVVMFFFISLMLLSSLSWAQKNSFLSFLFHTFNKLYARRVQSVRRLVVLVFFARVCVPTVTVNTTIFIVFFFFLVLFFMFCYYLSIITPKRKKPYDLNLGLSAFFFLSHLSGNSHRVVCDLSQRSWWDRNNQNFYFSLYRFCILKRNNIKKRNLHVIKHCLIWIFFLLFFFLIRVYTHMSFLSVSFFLFAFFARSRVLGFFFLSLALLFLKNKCVCIFCFFSLCVCVCVSHLTPWMKFSYTHK